MESGVRIAPALIERRQLRSISCGTPPDDCATPPHRSPREISASFADRISSSFGTMRRAAVIADTRACQTCSKYAAQDGASAIPTRQRTVAHLVSIPGRSARRGQVTRTPFLLEKGVSDRNTSTPPARN